MEIITANAASFLQIELAPRINKNKVFLIAATNKPGDPVLCRGGRNYYHSFHLNKGGPPVIIKLDGSIKLGG